MGRSTLSGRTLLKVDELGIPYVFAKELQVDEVVQEFNYSRLLQAFMNKTYRPRIVDTLLSEKLRSVGFGIHHTLCNHFHPFLAYSSQK